MKRQTESAKLAHVGAEQQNRPFYTKTSLMNASSLSSLSCFCNTQQQFRTKEVRRIQANIKEAKPLLKALAFHCGSGAFAINRQGIYNFSTAEGIVK